MVMINKITSKHIEILPGGTFNVNPYGGKDYYVNNITGSAYADGSTWLKAMDQISTAITASEIWRLAQWGTTTAANTMNRIFVKGTGTSYTALTTLPNFCQIIGIGAPSNGNGTGIAVIGADGADGIAGSARGLELYNLQIKSGGNFYCADFVQLLRSVIQDCTFMCYEAGTYGGIRFSGASGGNRIIGNHWSGGVAGSTFVTGIQIEGNNFDNCRIEGNFIQGSTAGIKVESTMTQGGGTVVKDNVIGGIDGLGCTLGVDDNTTNASGTTHIMYAGNYLIATGGGALVNGYDTFWVGNIIAHALAAAANS